ncbi:class I SAM-dependent methyltransferase [Flavobacterium sp.]|uniref:class I SAM-dependent methyltransferase n=1 Tax=Flavobacterium sp. TaxID=239 RepID=UPI002607C5C0|nr:class I SAM-dependent methyltransferase [Flavobacterium sp.]
MIQSIKKNIHFRTKQKIKNKWKAFLGFFAFGNLTQRAILFKTDKWGGHFYTPHYQLHFKPYRFKRVKLLEIGVGGYESPFSGGNSLRMWKSYFPLGKIFSLDIYDKSPQQESRIKIFQGSQVDFEFLQKVIAHTGELDLIIDDGSHINAHVIQTFEFLFPKLKKGGIYVIEDTQTSYWEHYGGTSNDFNQKGTIYEYFKSLIDGLNHSEYMIPDYQRNYYDAHIISMHFYHNMIFIYKGDNNETSNYLMNNKVKNG